MAAGATAIRRRPSTRKKRAPQSSTALVDSKYLNRDETWLEFNRRVLEEADDPTNPLLERVKFLAITSSNLDEFLEIRVAGILQQIEEDLGAIQKLDDTGLTLPQRLERLGKHLHEFTSEQAAVWNDRLTSALSEARIRIVRWRQLSKADRAFAMRYFDEQVDPLLTPVTIDPSHPFPRVLNKALCLALLLKFKRRGRSTAPASLGVITIPRSIPTLIRLPDGNGRRDFLPLDELIKANAASMFRGYRVLSMAAFRVTRNSNLYLEEEESRTVLESVAEELHNRRKGDVVRLEIDSAATEEIIERLSSNFELDSWQIFTTEGPVNLWRLIELYNSVQMPELKFPEFHGRRLQLSKNSNDIFDEMRKRDLLFHHPYDSYSAIEGFIETGTTDPNVVSIRQTLYRTSANSPMFRALTEAAQSIDVTVVIELMARFDEASNIRWARQLEDAGVQVYHGVFGYKTHCKLALLVRRDPDGQLREYVHLGTGNYNPSTARFYTDISLLTARPEITNAVQRVFRYLTAEWDTGPETYRPLLVAPVTLANDFLSLIAREADHARAGRPARIIAKMNALIDLKIIDALYAASQAGVEIDLIIRGMCTLRPGIRGLSDRICVRSIVGRFLEHTRIFWFQNGDSPEIFAGSADWMQRNLYERCEVVFPVTDELSANRLRYEILEAYLRDDVKARLMRPDGSYVRAPRKGSGFAAQDWLMNRAHHPDSAFDSLASKQTPQPALA
jgi:polyphosphate kinase